MAELRAKSSRLALALIVLVAFLNLFLPRPEIGWGWILGMAASMAGNMLLHNWVKVVTNTGAKRSFAAVFQGYGVRMAMALGVLAVAYVYPNSFHLVATGLGVMTFPFLVYLVAFRENRRGD